ncbi:AraC family transcriptional regulator [Paenibacillus rhizosphaerae]|uniref:AraC family transcriptional regulator n=1 Tax=Paenibacillus rhizosphaerae TaxID=297318 RepID=A0A1R1EFT9_9BACL|nr:MULTISPECIES: AraC family transcriptional regulator [Paenibacillus]MCM3001342.1 AraC family transcriptional regulator [Paenibacillus cellulositrophicus]OMF50619.1 AraC family transcriptional regulator [Paenibacillus rhizosphaerae]OXL85779.1 AraC family transcriptional regulator [Paenibacillus sp. SSG-1]
MKKLDIDRLTRAGVIYFNSKLEMLENLHCKMYRMNTLVSLSTHFHDYYQIWYVSKGEFVHTISNRQYRIRQGDLFLVPPFTLHRVQAFETEGEILGCEFMPSFINERFADPSGERRFFDAEYLRHFSQSDCTPHSQIAFDGVTDGRIRGLLQDMLGEYEERTPFFEIVLKASLLQLLSIIIRQVNGELVKAGFQKIERYRDTMNKVVEYIDRNAHEDIKLEHICAISNMSKPTICRLFKEWTGKTFNRYLVDLRISNALVLLQRPSMSITDVCYATGFNELAYFCRIFKKYTGISPNQFRKQVMGKPF